MDDSDNKILSTVIERNTEATLELGKEVHGLNVRLAESMNDQGHMRDEIRNLRDEVNNHSSQISEIKLNDARLDGRISENQRNKDIMRNQWFKLFGVITVIISALMTAYKLILGGTDG